jgi:DNA invertase Pin-like site-specific DNA recombinase
LTYTLVRKVQVMSEHLRLLLAARKSRKSSDGDTEMMYERQDHRAVQWAEREGHTVIHSTADTVSSQTPPWSRRELKPWMTDPAKLTMYDAILVSNTDRLSRGKQEDFVYIEHWASVHGKRIIVARGPQYPARTDSERGDWDGQKRAARNEWEAIADRHADTREIILENGAAIGRPPFGYRVTGTKLHKRFVIDAVTAPLALEAFTRIANGRTATSVAEWLSAETGSLWRVKRVCDMIRRRSYLGRRDTHDYEALVTEELWNGANEVLAGRSVTHGGRATVHAYSSEIYCGCGAALYHHQSTRNGQNVGAAKYRCSRGRRGVAGEAKCEYPALLFSWVNAKVDAAMRELTYLDSVPVVTGGDAAKLAELDDIRTRQAKAVASGDMGALTELVAAFNEVSSRETEPIRKGIRLTGKMVCDLWRDGNLADRRELLSGMFHVWVTVEGAHIDYEGEDEALEAA